MKARTSPELSNDEFELLRRLVEERTGILVSERKSYLIASRFASLIEEEGVDTFSELYTRARAAAPDGPLMDRIVDAITTNETLWFRDDGPWHILRTALLPRYCAELSQGRRNRVRIWSAACSTGQEPYSVAMTIREFIQDEGLVSVKPEAFEIVATDISPQALEIARRGAYDQMAASRGLPPQYADRFFESSGSTIEVVPAIKVDELVKFHSETDAASPALYTAVFAFVMNRARYEALPADLRKVIDDNGGADASAWAGRIWDESAVAARNKAIARGNQFNTVPESELRNWRDAADRVARSWVDEVSGKGHDGTALLRSARDLLRIHDGN